MKKKIAANVPLSDSEDKLDVELIEYFLEGESVLRISGSGSRFGRFVLGSSVPLMFSFGPMALGAAAAGNLNAGEEEEKVEVELEEEDDEDADSSDASPGSSDGEVGYLGIAISPVPLAKHLKDLFGEIPQGKTVGEFLTAQGFKHNTRFSTLLSRTIGANANMPLVVVLNKKYQLASSGPESQRKGLNDLVQLIDMLKDGSFVQAEFKSARGEVTVPRVKRFLNTLEKEVESLYVHLAYTRVIFQSADDEVNINILPSNLGAPLKEFITAIRIGSNVAQWRYSTQLVVGRFPGLDHLTPFFNWYGQLNDRHEGDAQRASKFAELGIYLNNLMILRSGGISPEFQAYLQHEVDYAESATMLGPWDR